MGYAAKLGSASSAKLNIVTIGESNSIAARTFNILSKLPNIYQKLTSNNFYFNNIRSGYQVNGSTSGGSNFIVSYNSQTGIASTPKQTIRTKVDGGNYETYFVYFTVYCVYID